MIRNLAAGGAGSATPLLQPRDDDPDGGLSSSIAADRGLGRRLQHRRDPRRRAGDAGRAWPPGRDYRLVLVRQEGRGYFRFRGYAIDATFSGFTEQPDYEDAREVADARHQPLRRR